MAPIYGYTKSIENLPKNWKKYLIGRKYTKNVFRRTIRFVGLNMCNFYYFGGNCIKYNEIILFRWNFVLIPVRPLLIHET